MTDVTEIAVPSTDRDRDLATLSASMDHKKSVSRFAIVAPSNVAFGLGRMYQTYRTLDSRSTKEIGVFRTMPEALAFLDIPTSLRMPELP
jgi:hypothetical protein